MSDNYETPHYASQRVYNSYGDEYRPSPRRILRFRPSTFVLGDDATTAVTITKKQRTVRR